MFVVGLTGGIASGKTTVANLFAELGAEIIDTDIIAREIVEPGKPAYEQIINHFSNEILHDDFTINRKKLANIIFNDKSEKLWLENLLHPLIRKIVKERVTESQAAYCIVVIPLLAETAPNPLLDHILVVDVTKETQIERLMTRDRIDMAHAKKMLANQANREQRLAMANDVIQNDTSVEKLREAVIKLHENYASS